MAQTITIPFYAVKLRFTTGGNISMPLMDQAALRIEQPLHLLAEKYAELFQKKVLNKGQYVQLIDEYREGTFAKDQVIIDFQAAKDKLSYPAFDLEFEYFYLVKEEGCWGIIPTLGIEAFAEDLKTLKERVIETIRLDFARKKRLAAVQQIIAAIWFDALELQNQDILLHLHTPAELEKITKEHKQELLPDVADLLAIKSQMTYGRKTNLEQLIRIVKGSFNRNILLVGATGVGKSALVWELDRLRSKHKIEPKIWETTASRLIKELVRETGWQDNLVYLCKELSEKGDYLFIRNFAELFQVGKYQGNEVSVAEFLRAFVARGDIKIITECTDEELAQIELKSPNYISFFQVLRLQEPPRKELSNIILKKVNDIAHARKVKLQQDAIEEVVRLNRRFTPYAGFPGKPIRFLESLLIHQSKSTTKKKKDTSENSDSTSPSPIDLTKAQIIEYFCEETGMPAFLVDPAIPMNLKDIKIRFNNNVYGQEVAVENVSNILASVKTALSRTGKPIASFLFVGPTGVGKTELAKVLADFTFGNRDRMIRFDMSEYSNPFSVIRLVGTSYFSDGLLTSAVRREPFCVLLFDEIEKADASFYDLLLQILSEGRLTDSRGKLVNFCSTIIIMTSNIGASAFQGRRIGWKKEVNPEEITQHFKSAAEKHFRPELFNRIDQIIPFAPLTKEVVRFVVEREIDLFKKREGIRFRQMDLSVDETVLDYLSEVGYDAKYGARQLQRTIRERLVVPLSKELNIQDFADRLIVRIFMETDILKIDIEADPLGFDLLLEQWDKLNHSEHVSDLRRSIQRMQEGPFFIRLNSTLENLEVQKRRLKEKFWKNQKRAEQYTYYLQTMTNVTKLTAAIEHLEEEISLSCLALASYDTNIEVRIKAWEAQFFDLKLEIYTRLHPSGSSCQLAIYGTQIEPILQFYRTLFETKSFTYTAETVWFRETYYKEEITEVNETGEIEKSPRQEYIKKEWLESDAKRLEPPAKGDQLYGIEFSLQGTCVYLYLKEEKGMQYWKLADNDLRRYIIQTSNKSKKTPTEIHRQNFYKKQSPRRHFEINMVKDSHLKANREITLSDAPTFFMELLDTKFKIALNQEVGC